jgi:phosphate transport system permease protein
LVLAGLTGLAFVLGRRRAVVFASAGRAHSLSGYHGSYVALWCALPALLLFVGWQILEPVAIRGYVLAQLPAELQALPEAQRGLIFNDIQNLV